MSLRLAARRSLAGAVRAPTVTGLRFSSSVTPQEKAQSILDVVPGNSVVSKTSFLTLTAAVSAAAISNEIFVVDEEVVLLGSTVVFVAFIANLIRAPFREYADSHIKKVSDFLNAARSTHTDAVKARIDDVAQLKDVEALTKSLFDLSKDTAKLEHETFLLKQNIALATEIKTVLDAHVRHEAQVREAEQADLVKSVLESVQKGLQDKKLQKSILDDAVAEVDKLVKAKAI